LLSVLMTRADPAPFVLDVVRLLFAPALAPAPAAELPPLLLLLLLVDDELPLPLLPATAA
jgi:hypothetical protein